MTIHFRGHLTPAHFRRMMLYQGRTLLILFGLLFILGNLSVLFPVFLGRSTFRIGTALALLFPNLLVIGGLWFYFIRGPQQTLKENRMFQGEIYGNADENGLAINGNGFSSRLQWKAYIAYKIQGDILLLYQSPQSLSVFPKSSFENNAEWEQFQTLISQHISLSAPPQNRRWLGITLLVIGAIIIITILRTVLAGL